VTTDANRMIAAGICDILDRHSDIFDDHPKFVREALVSRANIGKSCDVDDYVDRLRVDLLNHWTLRPMPAPEGQGGVRSDDAHDKNSH
jgi:hypothetical protein